MVRVWLDQGVLLSFARSVRTLCWDRAADRVIAVDNLVRIWDPGRAGK